MKQDNSMELLGYPFIRSYSKNGFQTPNTGFGFFCWIWFMSCTYLRAMYRCRQAGRLACKQVGKPPTPAPAHLWLLFAIGSYEDQGMFWVDNNEE